MNPFLNVQERAVWGPATLEMALPLVEAVGIRPQMRVLEVGGAVDKLPLFLQSTGMYRCPCFVFWCIEDAAAAAASLLLDVIKPFRHRANLARCSPRNPVVAASSKW